VGSEDYEALSAIGENEAPKSVEPSDPGALSKPDPRYAAAWRQMRALRRGVYLSLGGVLAVLPTALLVDIRSTIGGRYLWSGALFLAVMVVLGIHRVYMHVECPRCGGLFSGYDHERWRQRANRPMSMPKNCVHCGLPRGAERDPDQGQDQD
jgi:hypothetical protein